MNKPISQILEKIKNSSHILLKRKKPFTIIIYPLKNQDIQINNPHWNWSLGITYYNDKIIIKDN